MFQDKSPTPPGSKKSPVASTSPRSGKNLKDRAESMDEFDELEDANLEKVELLFRLSPMGQLIYDKKLPEIMIIDGALPLMDRLLNNIMEIYKLCESKGESLGPSLSSFIRFLNVAEKEMSSKITSMTSLTQLNLMREQLLDTDNKNILNDVLLRLLGKKSKKFSFCGKSDDVILTEIQNVLQGVFENKTFSYLSVVPTEEFAPKEGDWIDVDAEALEFRSTPPLIPAFYQERPKLLKPLCTGLTGSKSVHAIVDDNRKRPALLNAGLGKTTLAIAAINNKAVKQKFSKMVWVNVTAGMTKIDLYRAIAEQVFSVSFRSWVPESQVIRFFKNKVVSDQVKEKILVVLDGVTTVDLVCDLVHNVFGSGKSLKLLMTVNSNNISNFSRAVQFSNMQSHYVSRMSDEEAIFWLSLWSEENAKTLKTNTSVQKLIKLCGNLPAAINAMGFVYTEKEKAGYDSWESIHNALNEVNPLAASGFNDNDDEDESETENLLPPLNVRKAYIIMMKSLHGDIRKKLYTFGIFPVGMRISVSVLQILWGKEEEDVIDIVHSLEETCLLKISQETPTIVELDRVVHLFVKNVFQREQRRGGIGLNGPSAMTALMMASLQYIENSNCSIISTLVESCLRTFKWNLDMGGTKKDLMARFKLKLEEAKAEFFTSKYGSRKMSILNVVVAAGYFPGIKLLTDLGFDMQENNGEGISNLEIAGLNGLYETVKVFADNGMFSLTNTGSNGRTVLLNASSRGFNECVKCLIFAGGKIEDQTASGESCTFLASFGGHHKTVKSLIQRGADFNKAQNEGQTPLSVASSLGFVKVVGTLLEVNCDGEKKMSDGKTALWLAAKGNYYKVCEMLIKSGVTVNQSAKDGSTPLWIAASCGNKEIVQLLSDSGADIQPQNEDGTSAMFAAEAEGHEDTAELLKSLGAN